MNRKIEKILKRNDDIYERLLNGESSLGLAKKYGITQARINMIKNEVRAKREYPDEIYDLCLNHVDAFNICGKVTSLLHKNGIDTVDQLIAKPIEEIKCISGVGEKFEIIIKSMIDQINEERATPNLKMVLCLARHITPPVDGSVFPYKLKNLTNIEELETQARSSIWNMCYEKYKQGKKGYIYTVKKELSTSLLIDNRLHIDLYVTGLTVALCSVINVCLRENIKLTLWHHDRSIDKYYPQDLAVE